MINKKKFILKSKLPLILASKSAARREILLKTGLEFKQIGASVDEEKLKKKFRGINFDILAKKLAEEKALNVSKYNKDSYVIGAHAAHREGFKETLLDISKLIKLRPASSWLIFQL